jgi:hypothetical protein
LSDLRQVISDALPPYRLTADKREIRDFPKLPSATSFIRETLPQNTVKNSDTKYIK